MVTRTNYNSDGKIVLDNSADSGKIIMYTHGQTIILATSTSILFNIGDTLKLTLERIDNKFIATFYNITLSTSTTVSYTYATDISAGSGNKLIPDVGSLGLYILGGTSKITNYKITNNGLINGLAYIGDSITVGYGASIFKNSFVENISLERNWDIFGGVGETAAKVINGLTQITTQNIPKAAIIYLGVNETQNSISIATYKANLQTIIDSLTSINCKIYLITPSPLINYNSSTYATALIEVAILNNLEYLDIYSLMKNSYDYKMQSIYTNDLTHPNDLGHSFIARKIIEKFNSNYNSGYIKNESISVLKLSPELKAEVNLGTGLNIDWSLGVQFIKVLTANTVLTFSNITPCKTITLVVSGNYTLTFPSGVNVSDVYNFDGTKTNYIQIYCVNTTTPIFLTALKNY
jgi:lysophospholipase L1-like esterase